MRFQQEEARGIPSAKRLRDEAEETRDEDRTVRLEYRAFVALTQLSDAEQAAIKERVAALAELPPSEWSARVVRRPNVLAPYYVLPVEPSLRVVFSARAGHVPVVEEILRHDPSVQYANFLGAEKSIHTLISLLKCSTPARPTRRLRNSRHCFSRIPS